MNNPSSYKHVATKYKIVIPKNKKDSYMIITTKIRGTNNFGGVITNNINAIVNVFTKDITIVNQN